MPLSMLHPAPHGTQRKTRGQDGSLLLSCGALSSPTARRFIPTLGGPPRRRPVRGVESFFSISPSQVGWWEKKKISTPLNLSATFHRCCPSPPRHRACARRG